MARDKPEGSTVLTRGNNALKWDDSQPTVSVDFGSCLRASAGAECRTAQRRASGVLLSINQTHPRASVVEPLGLRNHRGDFDNLEDDFTRLRSLGMTGSIQSVLMDLFFGRGFNPPPKSCSTCWPGDGGQWSNWTDFVQTTVASLPHGAAIDVWNEPDGGFFFGRSYAQYFELWKRGVRTARATRPNVTVVGPSIAQFSTSWMQRFLDDCSNSSVLPDVVSWHEWGETGSEIPGDVASVRAMIKGIAQHHPGYSPSISLNEIVPRELNFRPAVHTTYFANLVRHALLHHEDLCRGLSGSVVHRSGLPSKVLRTHVGRSRRPARCARRTTSGPRSETIAGSGALPGARATAAAESARAA